MLCDSLLQHVVTQRQEGDSSTFCHCVSHHVTPRNVGHFRALRHHRRQRQLERRPRHNLRQDLDV